MNSAARDLNKSDSAISRRKSMLEKFGDPEYAYNSLIQNLRDGEFHSMTDTITSYIANNPKYKSQDDFAEAIGTSRQTLHRMFGHGNVSLNVFFDAMERIYDDAHPEE